MNVSDLREQVSSEFEAIEKTLNELAAFHRDIGDRSATVRDVDAVALFLANFYNGVENVLKRICRYDYVPLPSGGNWHVELAKGSAIRRVRAYSGSSIRSRPSSYAHTGGSHMSCIMGWDFEFTGCRNKYMAGANRDAVDFDPDPDHESLRGNEQGLPEGRCERCRRPGKNPGIVRHKSGNVLEWAI